MKIAAVVIDDWKLPIFKKHLDKDGYRYTEHPGITADTITLKVEYEWVYKVKFTLERAVAECEKGKMQ